MFRPTCHLNLPAHSALHTVSEVRPAHLLHNIYSLLYVSYYPCPMYFLTSYKTPSLGSRQGGVTSAVTLYDFVTTASLFVISCGRNAGLCMLNSAGVMVKPGMRKVLGRFQELV